MLCGLSLLLGALLIYENIGEPLQWTIYVSLSTVSSVIVCKAYLNIYMDKCACKINAVLFMSKQMS